MGWAGGDAVVLGPHQQINAAAALASDVALLVEELEAGRMRRMRAARQAADGHVERRVRNCWKPTRVADDGVALEAHLQYEL